MQEIAVGGDNDTARRAVGRTLLWIAVALVAGGVISLVWGSRSALEFLAAYGTEYALSVDNLLVFVVVFARFSVPPRLQPRVLGFGIAGAVVLRTALILPGAALARAFHPVLMLFGCVLIVMGARVLAETKQAPAEGRLALGLAARLPGVRERWDGRFVVREGGRRMATTLLLAVAAIELTDIVFAFDSIPAVLGITQDPAIAVSSNLLAVAGLRSLYVLVAGLLARARYLHVGLGLVLVFLGARQTVLAHVDVPPSVSLLVVLGLLGGAVIASRPWRSPR
jgi:tellurite resistance protein TerC